MNKIVLLTQDNCPNCTALKMFLHYGMKDAYQDDIEIVHKQAEPERYAQFVRQYEITSTPSFIAGGEVLRDCSPTKTIDFIKRSL